MINKTGPLDDFSVMPFGLHRGQQMIDVPASYLLNIYDTPYCTQNVTDYVKENKEVLEHEIKSASKS